MKFGIAAFLTARGIDPAILAERVESAGFESLFVPDHTHIPVASRYTFPWGNNEVPEYYSETLDPFIALTVAARSTRVLQIGTGVCLAVERDPITTAKEVSTLDVLSGGRLLFGVGAGWNEHEMRNHGTDPSRRFRLLRERVEAMKEIWVQDVASYEGTFVRFEDILSWPKPVQKPHPPVLIAGNGPRAVDRVLAFGDEWLPEPEADLGTRISELLHRAEAAGVERRVTVYSARVEDVNSYRRSGAHRAVFWVPPNDAVAAERRVDELARQLKL